MRGQTYGHAVPPRALVISGAALGVALAGAIFFPQSIAEYGFLTWLLALVPAFLLCHYRRWTNVLIVLAVAMVGLSLSYVVGIGLGWGLADWPPVVFVVATYIGLALGWGWLTEVKTAVTQRENAEHELRGAHVDLRKSHADLQLAQWKLLEADKLEAVGQLAAGVAHEVKNPLMTLLTGVRYLQQHGPADNPDVTILLEDMRDAVDRANTVITGLLDLSAPHELNPKPTDLHVLINQSAKMVKHELHKARVTLGLDLGPNIPRLRLDAMKIQQVLVNLLTNAAHATPPEGTITVRTHVSRESLVSDAAADATPGDLTTGRHLVVLDVEDTGSGIPADKLAKLFDPFFTTKPPGKGTGLGLSVSRQIVEMHDAMIDIGNAEEGGARVTIVFPIPEEGPNGREEAHPAG